MIMMMMMIVISNNNLFNFSSFTISEGNYRLTLGYHDIASFL